MKPGSDGAPEVEVVSSMVVVSTLVVVSSSVEGVLVDVSILEVLVDDVVTVELIGGVDVTGAVEVTTVVVFVPWIRPGHLVF